MGQAWGTSVIETYKKISPVLEVKFYFEETGSTKNKHIMYVSILHGSKCFGEN